MLTEIMITDVPRKPIETSENVGYVHPLGEIYADTEEADNGQTFGETNADSDQIEYGQPLGETNADPDEVDYGEPLGQTDTDKVDHCQPLSETADHGQSLGETDTGAEDHDQPLSETNVDTDKIDQTLPFGGNMDAVESKVNNSAEIDLLSNQKAVKHNTPVDNPRDYTSQMLEGPVVRTDTNLQSVKVENRCNCSLQKSSSSLSKDMHKVKGWHKHNGSDLIINTYMRSGSTFLGSVFSIRPDTFYVFEPLWKMQKMAFFSGNNELCSYYKNKCSPEGQAAVENDVGENATINEARKFLKSLLDCSFYQPRRYLPDKALFPEEFQQLQHSWRFWRGKTWTAYRDCAKANKTYDQCLDLIKPVCRSCKHHVLKVLRLTLDNYEPLLNEMTNLKVIQLFRDPRGILNSHLTTGFYKKKVNTVDKIKQDMKTHCKRILYDIDVAKAFQVKYPDRFRVVQYEDFFDLEKKASALYDFMGMDKANVTKELNNLIKPQDSRSGFHPYSYRTKLPWHLERLILKDCRQVYLELGYPIFDTEEDYKNKPEKEVIKRLPYALD